MLPGGFFCVCDGVFYHHKRFGSMFFIAISAYWW